MIFWFFLFSGPLIYVTTNSAGPMFCVQLPSEGLEFGLVGAFTNLRCDLTRCSSAVGGGGGGGAEA